MVIDIKEDLSKLVTIDKLYIDRIFNKINWCISDYVEKAIAEGDNLVEVDLGFGTLSILIENDNVRYRFKPSPTLEKSLVNTIINEQNELDLVVEKNLVQKLVNIYKEMF